MKAATFQLSMIRTLFVFISTTLGGGKAPYLFTPQHASTKLDHNRDVTDDFEQIVCYMLPHTLAKRLYELLWTGPAMSVKFRNVCRSSTRGCRAACLHTSGRLAMAEIAKLARTVLFSMTHLTDGDYSAFWRLADAEITRNKARVAAKGKTLVVRVNGTSDVEIPGWILRKHHDVIFSDYTKHEDVKLSWSLRHPNQYRVFSATENTPISQIRTLLEAGHNVVVPFDIVPKGEMITSWHGMPVIDGDKHDLRFLDEPGNIVGLRYKLPRDRSVNHHGFIQETQVSLVA